MSISYNKQTAISFCTIRIHACPVQVIFTIILLICKYHLIIVIYTYIPADNVMMEVITTVSFNTIK